MPYLLKTEPEAYSYADLERERETDWTGVANPQAIRNLAAMKKGDEVVIYHTGKEKSAVGLARVVSVDPSNAREPLVRIAPVRRLMSPKTLSAMKERAIFGQSPLLHQGRLSVVPLTQEQYNWIAG
ncbi:MAG TPA: EVE domain-containing protein [Acidobacteriaceae bacterium]|jgi:predicted RNA-binding protein with PUA-like domain|nr:EVE domain-containing protein [Acidobacteriaceae bacterium]